MNEHPILFSGEMVRAILEGRKTQTRRVIKGVDGGDKFLAFGIYGKALFTDNILNIVSGKPHDFLVRCPYGLPGDRLWVRETWQMIYERMDGQRFTHPIDNARQRWVEYAATSRDEEPPRWKPSIHMPRKCSRLTLEIVNIRVERVKDITAMDCIAEGIMRSAADEIHQRALDEKYVYQELWDKINAARGYGWEVNPWVWVIEFKRV
jgi:hypothetical protein